MYLEQVHTSHPNETRYGKVTARGETLGAVLLKAGRLGYGSTRRLPCVRLLHTWNDRP